MICVVGLGEIGEAVFKEIISANKALEIQEEVIGYDIDLEKTSKLKKEGFNVTGLLPKADKYLVCVYSTEQVKDVLKQIFSLDFYVEPLISIESTIKPGTIKWIKEFKKQTKKNFNLVLFPHRYNPGDRWHHVFNQHRLLGGLTKKCVKRAREFYSQYMLDYSIKVFPIEIVELAKPLENAYRFTEIAIAEELKGLCDFKGIDFNLLREACNTKWNIDIKEARDGIYGKCLPKDMKIINEFFSKNSFFKIAEKADRIYRREKE